MNAVVGFDVVDFVRIAPKMRVRMDLETLLFIFDFVRLENRVE